jgi:hypothetical protein
MRNLRREKGNAAYNRAFKNQIWPAISKKSLVMPTARLALRRSGCGIRADALNTDIKDHPHKGSCHGYDGLRCEHYRHVDRRDDAEWHNGHYGRYWHDWYDGHCWHWQHCWKLDWDRDDRHRNAWRDNDGRRNTDDRRNVDNWRNVDDWRDDD